MTKIWQSAISSADQAAGKKTFQTKALSAQAKTQLQTRLKVSLARFATLENVTLLSYPAATTLLVCNVPRDATAAQCAEFRLTILSKYTNSEYYYN